jgi:hypothetical protein
VYEIEDIPTWRDIKRTNPKNKQEFYLMNIELIFPTGMVFY